MAETKINVNQTNITAASIGASESVVIMPVVDMGDIGKIVQYVGTTDANYTNGYFYKCVSDGGNPATYSWSRIDVQPSNGGGGGDYLPQYSSMPAVTSTDLGKIVQFVGTTDASYTNGYTYRVTEHSVPGSYTASQTGSHNMEDIYFDVSAFEENIHPTTNLTLQFECIAEEDPMGDIVDDPSGLTEDYDSLEIGVWAQGLLSQNICVFNREDFYAVYTDNGWVVSWELDGSDPFYSGLPTGITLDSGASPSEGDYIEISAWWFGEWTETDSTGLDVDFSYYGGWDGYDPVPGDTVTINYVLWTLTYTWDQANTQPVPTASELGVPTMSYSRYVALFPGSSWEQGYYQWVSVPEVTGSSSVVLVSPYMQDGTSYDDWIQYGVRCDGQQRGRLEFRCNSTPTRQITAEVVVFNH